MSASMNPDMPSTLPGDPLFDEIIGKVAAAAADRIDKEWGSMSKRDIVSSLRKWADVVPVPPAAAAMEAAADEIERLRGTVALTDGEMVKWLTEQVKERDNIISQLKVAGFDQITKAFVENRWIPVGERLPPDDTECLTVDADGTCRVARFDAVGDGERPSWYEQTNFMTVFPVAWMMIPVTPDRAMHNRSGDA